MSSAKSILEKYPYIDAKDVNSFARFTLEKRLPRILDQIISENTFDEPIIDKLEVFKTSLPKGVIDTKISDGPDSENWNRWITPYADKSWLEVPFYFAEACFYRLVLEFTGYFKNHIDPFAIQKKKDILLNQVTIQNFILILDELKNKNASSSTLLNYAVKTSLWGNKSDLSQLQTNLIVEVARDQKNTIIDDFQLVLDVLFDGVNNVDIILDNSGVELFTDLLLAEQLISNHFVQVVRLHTKAFPTFVSDATTQDIHILLDQLKRLNHTKLNEFLKHFTRHISEGKITIKSDPFWNSPLHFYQMPKELFSNISKTDLLIFKGDANYRRIFGDRVIPHELNPAKFTEYLPAKSIALRILKSEIQLGMSSNFGSNMNQTDPDWMINGEFGIIQVLN